MADESRLRTPDDLARYSRQVIFPPIGVDGQRRLLASRVTLIGCGALGSVLADTLVRAGVGFLRIVDRDYVELNNLQRQILFTEADAECGAPKAAAAAQRLAAVNSGVVIEPAVVDATSANIESLIDKADLVLDGTDNFETRFLINDAAVRSGRPWVYGACVAGTGMVMSIVPRQTPCLRCVFNSAPPPGANPTCDTAGVLGGIVHVVAGIQSAEALRLLTGQPPSLGGRLLQIDAWDGQFDVFDMGAAREAGDCPCCKRGVFEYLDAPAGSRTATLCGRDAVQIGAAPGARVDFDAVAARVAPVAKSAPRRNRYLLRFEVDEYQVTLFPDGRAIIKGTNEPDAARTVYAKYVGA